MAARGGEEVGGAVVGEGLVEVLDGGVGVGGEVVRVVIWSASRRRSAALLRAQAATVRLAARRSRVALTRSSPVGGVGPQAEVAAFGGLAAGDAEWLGQVCPAGARIPGRFDQAGRPVRELFADFTKQHPIRTRVQQRVDVRVDESDDLDHPLCGQRQGFQVGGLDDHEVE